MTTNTAIMHNENYYVEAAIARGLSFPAFVRASMDEYIKQHPPISVPGASAPANRNMRIPFEDAMALCGITGDDLEGFEKVELE